VPDKEVARDKDLDVPAPSPRATLEVATTPALAVSVDGKLVGRAPVSLAIAPGRHRLTLADPALGIQLVRNVQAKPGENRLAITVGKGTVTINAPSGCEVRVDGRVVGRTPLAAPLPVFEGSHRVQVSMGAAIWQQAFNLADGEHMTFDVETDVRQSP
jgi:serine/threonine-protein kinase